MIKKGILNFFFGERGSHSFIPGVDFCFPEKVLNFLGLIFFRYLRAPRENLEGEVDFAADAADLPDPKDFLTEDPVQLVRSALKLLP